MKKILLSEKIREGGIKMKAISAKRLFMFVIAVFSISFLVGCSGMEKRPEDRTGWFFPHPAPLVNADRALDEARMAGKDRECPDEFNALKDMVDRAWAVYRACDTYGAIIIANEATAELKSFCPRKPVAEVKPEPKVVVPPPAPKPEPTPPPPPPAATVIDRLTIHVKFDFDKSNIRKTEEAELNKAIDFVRKYPDSMIELEGHTDSKGTEKYNQKLSEKRAESVRQYLIKEGGVDKAKISARGYGELRPIAPNKTKEGRDNPEGRAENRRVEILIMSD